jgi:hypothetical protein
MADTKISALGDIATLAAGDKIPVADVSDLTVSKSATMTEVATFVASVVVEDSVTDAHTTVAPSGNAVFDALALKSPLASPTFTGTVTLPKIVATPSTCDATSSGVAIPLTSGCCEISTDADNDLDNATLADGAVGQIIYAYCKTQGSAGATLKITPATSLFGTNWTFAGNPLGQGLLLAWTSSGWVNIQGTYVPNWKTGIATKNINDVSATQNIAHGLGRIPKFVRVAAHMNYAAGYSEVAEGSYDGTDHAGMAMIMYEGTSTAQADTIFTSIAFELGFAPTAATNPYTGANRQTATVTVDATNIILTWTKTGTVASNTVNIIWSCT